MKLGQKVAYEETFKMVCHRTTLTEGQGRKMNLKCGNGYFLQFLTLNTSGIIDIWAVNFVLRVFYGLRFKMI